MIFGSLNLGRYLVRFHPVFVKFSRQSWLSSGVMEIDVVSLREAAWFCASVIVFLISMARLPARFVYSFVSLL